MHGPLIATAVVAHYLEQHLTWDEAPLKPYIGPTRLLASSFTLFEMGAATMSLRKWWANGLDGIPNELSKYSSNSIPTLTLLDRRSPQT